LRFYFTDCYNISFIFGTSQIPSTAGAIAGLAAFMILGYQFDKKE
jgi:hypothetical protein